MLLTVDLIREKGGGAGLHSKPSSMTTASIFSDFWNELVEHEEQGLFLVLAGFILSFAFIRMSTRMMRSPRVSWWPGSVVSDGGVHLHHLVFGIVAMMIGGTLGFAALGDSPYVEICAFVFGVGAGLTIDEFALWVYLDDVYWAEEGRSSIDATVIAAAGMLLLLLGFSPFSFDTSSVEQTIGSILGAAVVFGLVAVCFAKQRVMHGTDRLLRLPDRDLRRRADRQARLALGPPALRRAAAEEAGEGRRALPARPAHRALQERLPRHHRRQAQRGSRGGSAGGTRRHPRGGRRSPRSGPNTSPTSNGRGGTSSDPKGGRAPSGCPAPRRAQPV